MRQLLTRLYIVYTLTAFLLTAIMGFLWVIFNYYKGLDVISRWACRCVVTTCVLVQLTLIKMINYYYVEKKRRKYFKLYLFLIPLAFLFAILGKNRISLILTILPFLPYYVVEKDIDVIPILLLPFLDYFYMPIYISFLAIIVLMEIFWIMRDIKGKAIVNILTYILFIITFKKSIICAKIFYFIIFLYALISALTKPITFRIKLSFLSLLLQLLTVISSFTKNDIEASIFHVAFSVNLGLEFVIFCITIARRGWIKMGNYRLYTTFVLAGIILLVLNILSRYFSFLYFPTFVLMAFLGMSFAIVSIKISRGIL